MDNNQNNTVNIFPKFIVIVFFLLVGFWFGRYVEVPFLPNNQAKIQVTNKIYNKDNVDFASFWKVWDELNQEFLFKKDLSGTKLLQGAIKGLVEAADDPYTAYFDPEANKAFNDQISGSFEGVGMELGVRDQYLVVIAPIEGSPADKAGIQASDRIISVEGKDSSQMSLGEAVKLIRGKAGTKVKIEILRGQETTTRKFEITRGVITIKSVKLEVKDGIGIINLNQFGEKTISEWDGVINGLKTKGIKKVIIDLRNNPGGFLESAIHIAGDFLTTRNVVVQQEDANGKRTQKYNKTEGRLRDVQVVILINKGSASASEIVTGALSDHNKAKVVGETSFGKGTVQAVDNLNDGSGLHLTVAKWLTPKGTWVHKKGIEPDIKVVLTEDDLKNNKDPQLSKAIEILK